MVFSVNVWNNDVMAESSASPEVLEEVLTSLWGVNFLVESTLLDVLLTSNILLSVNGHSSEIEFVLGKGSCLIREDVCNLAQFFVDWQVLDGTASSVLNEVVF